MSKLSEVKTTNREVKGFMRERGKNDEGKERRLDSIEWNIQ